MSGFDDLSRQHREFSRRLEGIDESLGAPIEQVIEDTAEDVLEDAQNEIVRQGLVDEGDLLRSGSVRPEGDRFSRFVEFDHEAAEALEYGTRPHVIGAAPGSALAFTVPERIISEIPGGGSGFRVSLEDKQVIVSEVDHPGNEAFRFLRTAVNRNDSKLVRELRRAVDEVFEAHF